MVVKLLTFSFRSITKPFLDKTLVVGFYFNVQGKKNFKVKKDKGQN